MAQTKGTEAMAAARHRTGAGPIVDSKSAAVAELMLEVAQCFFRIRALGQKTGLITSWGGGAFGFNAWSYNTMALSARITAAKSAGSVSSLPRLTSVRL